MPDTVATTRVVSTADSGETPSTPVNCGGCGPEYAAYGQRFAETPRPGSGRFVERSAGVGALGCDEVSGRMRGLYLARSEAGSRTGRRYVRQVPLTREEVTA